MRAMDRRGFIRGLVGIVAAPAIVRVGSLMPVRALSESVWMGTRTTRGLVFVEMVLEEFDPRDLANFYLGELTWKVDDSDQLLRVVRGVPA